MAQLAERPEWQQSAQEELDGLSHLRISPDRLMMGSALYYGSMSEVAFASLLPTPNGESIAPEEDLEVVVKKVHFNTKGDPEKNYNGFVHEAKILSQLSHPNIVNLIGFFENVGARTASLIFPWRLPLSNFITTGEWQIPERVSLIKDLMNGLHYLHSQEPPIIHGDLKASNILVDPANHAVITDFGSARRMRRDSATDSPWPTFDELFTRSEGGFTQPQLEYSAVTGTLTLSSPGYTDRWAAPEVLVYEWFGPPGDIWSFAWISWEIMTNKEPYPEIGRQAEGLMVIVLSEGRPPDVREQEGTFPILQLCSLMVECWSFDPRKRPDAARCKARLEWMPSAVPSVDAAEVQSPQLFLKIGDMHRLHSRPNEALEAFERALEISRRIEDHKATAGAMLLLAESYKDLSRLLEAESSFKGALEYYDGRGDRTGMGTASIGLANVYDTMSETAKAETHYRLALDAFSQVNNDLGRANSMIGLGRIYKGQSKLDQAKKSYQDAEEIYLRIGDEMGRANALLGLGRVHQAQSEAEDAEKKCKEAEEIYTRIGGELGRANALETLGDIYRAQSMYQESRSSYVEAAEIYGGLKYEHGQANTMLGLGRIHYVHSEYSQAESVYKEALDIHTRVGDLLGRANALAWLADTYRAESRYREAEETYVQANDTYLRADDDLGRASVLLGLGQVLQAQSKIAEAEVAFAEAAEASKRVGNQTVQIHAIMTLGLIYGNRGDYRAAENQFAEAVAILSGSGNETALAAAQKALEGYRKLAKGTHRLHVYIPLWIFFFFKELFQRALRLLWFR
ncbi:hypothetical protein FRC01_013673 [Tulasnella sp. 417]|nr:hypothetical protein FRC01_013673 [Tulasnella sp. 417]